MITKTAATTTNAADALGLLAGRFSALADPRVAKMTLQLLEMFRLDATPAGVLALLDRYHREGLDGWAAIRRMATGERQGRKIVSLCHNYFARLVGWPVVGDCARCQKKECVRKEWW